MIAILNTYQRPQMLTSQIEAIKGQTVKTEIVIYRNDDWPEDFPYQTFGRIGNYGVWPRFSLPVAEQLDSEFYLVLDDDTIPGKKWVECCLNAYQDKPGVYCASGFVFLTPDYGLDNWSQKRQIGWIDPRPTIQRVDWPGHSWFFDRQVAEKFSEIPPYTNYSTCGEDIHLAFCAQKLGQDCWVLPQMSKETCGSLYGKQGNDLVALWRQPGQRQRMSECINAYRFAGWKWMID